MSLRLVYSINDKSVQAAFRKLSQFDPQDSLEEIGEYLLGNALDNFSESKTVDGNAMETSRRAQEQSGKTLVDHGLLRDSYTFNVSGTTVEVGSNDIRAAIHHFGGTIKPKSGEYLTFKVGDQFVRVREVNIPARPVLGIVADDERRITDIVSENIRRQAA